MCKTNNRRRVRRGNRNVKVLCKYVNRFFGVQAELTRKTTIAGDIIYAVVVTNLDTGYHRLINTYKTILEAYTYYKGLLTAAGATYTKGYIIVG